MQVKETHYEEIGRTLSRYMMHGMVVGHQVFPGVILELPGSSLDPSQSHEEPIEKTQFIIMYKTLTKRKNSNQR